MNTVTIMPSKPVVHTPALPAEASIPGPRSPHTLENSAAPATDYTRVEAAIRYLDAHYQEQPNLDDLAAYLHLSPYHLQRLFTRWAGISPKRFVQYLTLEHAKQALATSATVLDASLDSGLSGPGRLHDLFVSAEAVTPGEYKTGGLGLRIAWGVYESPFGNCLLAVTDRGICGLTFCDEGVDGAVASLRARWPAARVVEESATARPYFDTIFPGGAIAPHGATHEPRPVHLLLKGTNFQIRVWEALLRIPSGGVSTYENIARAIGEPKASRAVGSAIGSNTIAYLIPCHRVIRKTGAVGGYRWSPVRKKAMLGWEAGHMEQ